MGLYKIQRKLFGSILILAVMLVSVIGQAQSVPNVITFQSVIFDDGGNVIEDDSADILFRILDDQGTELYAEEQPAVQIFDGMINVLLGSGIVPNSNPAVPTGGLIFTDFNPANPLFLEVTVKNVTTLDQLELTSVPYAFYAQQALTVAEGAITATSIENGAITVEHLENISISQLTGVLDVTQLPPEVTMDTELSSHTSDTSNPHNVTAAQVGAATAGHNHDSAYVNVGGDTMSGNLSMGGNNITNVGFVDGVDLNDSNSALNSDGSIKGAGYSGIGFRVSQNVVHGTNVCSLIYIPSGFGVSDCGSAVTFVPSLSQYEGDGGGTERVTVFIDGTFRLNICADSRCSDGSDGKLPNQATIIAIGTR